LAVARRIIRGLSMVCPRRISPRYWLQRGRGTWAIGSGGIFMMPAVMGGRFGRAGRILRLPGRGARRRVRILRRWCLCLRSRGAARILSGWSLPRGRRRRAWSNQTWTIQDWTPQT